MWYTENNKQEPLEKLNNPTTIFGEKNTPYCIIWGDSVGNSIFGGGMSCVYGYTYDSDMHGTQVIIKYNPSESIKIRTKTKGEWSELINIGYHKIDSLTTQSLNDVKSTGIYYQGSTIQATAERNYPIKQAGLLEVDYFTTDWIYQRYTPYDSGRVYKRVFHNGWQRWYEFTGNVITS